LSALTAIAALTSSRVIGKAGGLPWHLPGDLRFFKEATMGQVIVMGRATYDSIGRLLPGRETWILSSTLGPIPGARILRSVAEVAAPGDGRRLFVVGGAGVYRALLPRCGELLLTHVREEYEGDTFFPEYEEDFPPVETLVEAPLFTIRRHVRRA
jgi:dihydrofolate reductase